MIPMRQHASDRIPTEVDDMIRNQPKDKLFDDEQVKILKSWHPKSKYLIKYATWKQERKNDMYILFIVDQMPNRVRKSAVDHSIKVVCTRELTDDEHTECVQNIDCWNRVMRTWSYKTIEQLIEDDQNIGIETPQEFIDHCRKHGWTSTKRIEI